MNETEEGHRPKRSGEREIMCESVKKYGDIQARKTVINSKIDTVRNIMDNLKLGLDQALDAMGIYGEERTAISSILKQ